MRKSANFLELETVNGQVICVRPRDITVIDISNRVVTIGNRDYLLTDKCDMSELFNLVERG